LSKTSCAVSVCSTAPQYALPVASGDFYAFPFRFSLTVLSGLVTLTFWPWNKCGMSAVGRTAFPSILGFLRLSLSSYG